MVNGTGSNGGGNGGYYDQSSGNVSWPGEAGLVNSGGGGGGGMGNNSATNGGAGGSGICILKYWTAT
jgi:hypothetical protein